jgi:NADH-quinone oxidoreductase subunit F
MRMFAVSGHVNKPGIFEVPNGVTTFRMLFEAPEYCGGIRGGRKVKAFIPGGASAMWFYEEHLDMPLDKPTVDKAGRCSVRCDHRDGRDDRRRSPRAGTSSTSSRARAVGSAPRAARARRGSERILKRIISGHGRPEDLDLLMEVSETISPGIAWPPRQTTICPLGPSAVSPIASTIRRFRHEFEHYIEHGRPMDGIDAPPVHGAAHGARVHV